MPDKCCIRFCNSNYNSTKEYTSVFKIPKDENMRQLWLANIPKKGLVLGKRTVVCAKHFAAEDIIWFDELPENGNIIQIRRRVPRLKKTAYPTIFNESRNRKRKEDSRALRYLATAEQLSIILDYMEADRDLSIQTDTKEYSVKSTTALWVKLRERLNNVKGGYRKTPKKWMKTWCDWKSAVKRKGISIRKAKKRMVECQKVLTDLEERCFALIASTTLLNDSDSDTSSKDVGDSDTCSKDAVQVKIEVDVEDEEAITSDITPAELTRDIKSPEIKDTTVDDVTQLRITAVKSIDTDARDVGKADTTVAGVVGNATVGVQKFIPVAISSTRLERLKDIVAVKTKEPQNTLENAPENPNIATTSMAFDGEKRPFVIKIEDMDSEENLGTKIKIEVEEEEVITPELTHITPSESKDTTIDDVTQLRITGIKSLDPDARDMGETDTNPVGITGNATARVQKVIPVVSSTRVERLRDMAAVKLEEPQKALGNASRNQNITSTSNEALPFVSEKRPFFIKVEDMDSGENFGTKGNDSEDVSTPRSKTKDENRHGLKRRRDSKSKLMDLVYEKLSKDEDDEYDIIGRNIAHKLRTLAATKKETAMAVEKLIYELIFKGHKDEVSQYTAITDSRDKSMYSPYYSSPTTSSAMMFHPDLGSNVNHRNFL